MLPGTDPSSDADSGEGDMTPVKAKVTLMKVMVKMTLTKVIALTQMLM